MDDKHEAHFVAYSTVGPDTRFAKSADWDVFVKDSRLDKPLFTIDDIEFYDWSNQTIGLKTLLKSQEPLRRSLVFAIGSRRLFGGEIISPLSARAVDYPVIYQGQMSGKTVFVLRPSNRLAFEQPDLKKGNWDSIATSTLKDYLSKTGKLRESGAKESFEFSKKAVFGQ